jgi:uncharacterized protein DUF1573
MMRDRWVATVVAAALALGLGSQSIHARPIPATSQAAPIAEADDASFDFGSVIQGVVIAHTFVLRNSSDSSVRILGLDLTPGLRLTSVRAQLDPGQQADLNISLDTTAMRGAYSGKVTVRLNDPARALAVFALAGVIVPRIEFRPYAAFFLSGDRRGPAEASIEIVNHDEVPLRITRVEHPVDRLTARLEPLEEGRRYRLNIALRTDAAAGQREDIILLHTDQGRVLRVAANTRLRERVYAFPLEVDLGSLPLAELKQARDSGGASAQTLMVYQVGGTDFKATFLTDVPGLHVSAARGPNGDRWQATITADSTVSAGPVHGSIVVETNDQEFPRLLVPVTGTILAD